MKPTTAFTLGIVFAFNGQGLIQDIAGRDAVIAYVNNPDSWVNSAITAPVHVILMLVCALMVGCSRPNRLTLVPRS